ncbi:myb/SANT-like DNA-binding domain-containing protein 2 [Chrysemys picta bellii]|uniref:myb/SANT-like DNA-binding domain-containing protein 2 n=1 Tax=Chrysemys picta bellii TaxID=8478 RepID=UPI0032B140BE
MESQDHKRAPAWTEREVRDLLAIWGDEAVIAELRSSKRNGKVLEKISKAMKDRGHNRDTQQCRVKIKELRQAYHKAREANGRSGAEPQTCRYYAELHAILGGAATTTPTVCYDSLTGETHREDGSGNEEDEDGGTVGSSQQQGSGETGFPNSQDMFGPGTSNPRTHPRPSEHTGDLCCKSFSFAEAREH